MTHIPGRKYESINKTWQHLKCHSADNSLRGKKGASLIKYESAARCTICLKSKKEKIADVTAFWQCHIIRRSSVCWESCKMWRRWRGEEEIEVGSIIRLITKSFLAKGYTAIYILRPRNQSCRSKGTTVLPLFPVIFRSHASPFNWSSLVQRLRVAFATVEWTNDKRWWNSCRTVSVKLTSRASANVKRWSTVKLTGVHGGERLTFTLHWNVRSKRA